MHQDREACQDLAQHAADIARDLYRGLDTPRNPDQAMQALVEEFLRCADPLLTNVICVVNAATALALTSKQPFAAMLAGPS